jgi:hypothetical protein
VQSEKEIIQRGPDGCYLHMTYCRQRGNLLSDLVKCIGAFVEGDDVILVGVVEREDLFTVG